MADFTFNIALGRVVHYAARAQAGDGQLVARILKAYASGQTDSTVRDVDTLAQLKAVATEADFTGYGERVLQNVQVLVNDSSSAGAGPLAGVDPETAAVDCDDWSYSPAGGTTNNSTTKMVICYKPATNSPDSSIIPLVSFDYVETTTGSTLNILVPTGGFWSAGDAA